MGGDGALLEVSQVCQQWTFATVVNDIHSSPHIANIPDSDDEDLVVSEVAETISDYMAIIEHLIYDDVRGLCKRLQIYRDNNENNILVAWTPGRDVPLSGSKELYVRQPCVSEALYILLWHSHNPGMWKNYRGHIGRIWRAVSAVWRGNLKALGCKVQFTWWRERQSCTAHRLNMSGLFWF